ncbi:hypothetical protein J6Y73_03050 [bacterium]|nr:hypothetical protein [bacterium]
MKKKRDFIIIASALIFIIFSFILIYLLVNKFDDVDILSVKKEYNRVFESSEDTLDIPIYIGKRNTFLSNYKEIESTSISSNNIQLKASLSQIEVGCTLIYNRNKYYEYIYHLSFDSYDSFQEPLFMSDGLFNITYKNGNRLSFRIGNLSLFFNSNLNTRKDIFFSRLQAVTNEIEGIETIVGVNISIKNNTDSSIHIKSISIKNEHYDLDYMNYENKQIDTALNLRSRDESYNYTRLFIDKSDMNLNIEPIEIKDIFIPLIYTKAILSLDRFPVYIEYEIDENEYLFVQDDFQFMKRMDVLNHNGIEKYVYRYH